MRGAGFSRNPALRDKAGWFRIWATGDAMPKSDTHMTMRVVNHIRTLIETGDLQPGDQIPPEREFARKLRISRASLRTGIGYLAAMGVMDVRHGVGTFVADGPPELGKSSLSLLGALHGFQSWQMFEARRILESELAALAADRGKEQHLAAMSEEVAEMYATVDNPIEYLIHDVRFHRVIAQASGNPILAALMETITSALYDERRKTAERSRDLKQSADLHREIYRAIRSRDAGEARSVMERHLTMAQSAQDLENSAPGPPSNGRATKKARKRVTEA
jgi:GntR family transcriptional repressor for pyruvate dehydrogenase complex